MKQDHLKGDMVVITRRRNLVHVWFWLTFKTVFDGERDAIYFIFDTEYYGEHILW